MRPRQENAEESAETLLKRLTDDGLAAHTKTLYDFKAGRLADEQVAVFVVSTFGEGEPPDDAIPFYEGLQALPAGSLPGLKYAVFALGDKCYDEFCKFGRDIDAQLERLGAERILAMEECDLDQDVKLPPWADQLIPLLAEKAGLYEPQHRGALYEGGDAAMSVAFDLAAALFSNGHDVTVAGFSRYLASHVLTERTLVICADETQPGTRDEVLDFVDFADSLDGGSLSRLSFSVLSLGQGEIGVNIDSALAGHGAARLARHVTAAETDIALLGAWEETICASVGLGLRRAA